MISEKKEKLSPEQKQQLQSFMNGLDSFFRTSTDEVDDLSLKAQLDRMQKEKKVFERWDHYSQTEACAKFNITRNQFNQLCKEHGIQQVNKEVELGGYKVVTRYVLKSDFDALKMFEDT